MRVLTCLEMHGVTMRPSEVKRRALVGPEQAADPQPVPQVTAGLGVGAVHGQVFSSLLKNMLDLKGWKSALHQLLHELAAATYFRHY